ncbi:MULTISPECIES: hypothetical protein [Catenuloplanes]|uniref:Uncharacterized protein n=1 Tax=Catenuloplanes niger TaxID=587534 RepID=A0AAE3ZM12_9ACTN|nr:hypothetical protein [Catenuloplanes niger]MDR7321189.1 hypothetical protein [Catenuloplanes niger]
MLPQERLIARVHEACAADPRLTAALTYGSFPAGAGDAHSDVEFWLFFAETPPDARSWLDALGPVATPAAIAGTWRHGRWCWHRLAADAVPDALFAELDAALTP